MTYLIGLYIDYNNIRFRGQGAFRPDEVQAEDFPKEVSPSRLKDEIEGRLREERGLPEKLNIETRVYHGKINAPSFRRWVDAEKSRGVQWIERDRVQLWNSEIPIGHRDLDLPLNERPFREKGIDTALAVDFLIGVRKRLFDLMVLFSMDQDILQTIKYVNNTETDETWKRHICLCTWAGADQNADEKSKNTLRIVPNFCKSLHIEDGIIRLDSEIYNAAVRR